MRSYQAVWLEKVYTTKPLYTTLHKKTHRTARHGTVRHGTVQHGTVRHGTVRHGTHCTAQPSRAEQSTTPHRTTQEEHHIITLLFMLHCTMLLYNTSKNEQHNTSYQNTKCDTFTANQTRKPLCSVPVILTSPPSIPVTNTGMLSFPLQDM